MNIFIFLFPPISFFLDLVFTGMAQFQNVYFLYIYTAYYFTFYTPMIIPTAYILTLCALQSFFITGIFGLWILHIVPVIFFTQLSKNFIKNNYILCAATFLLLISGNYLLYTFYLKTIPPFFIILKQLAYHCPLLIITMMIYYFMYDQ